MATCVSYNCSTLTDWEAVLENCSPFRSGGTTSIILLACDHQITDPTSLTEIDAEIAAGRAWRMDGLKAGLTPQTPETIAPVTSCGTERVINNVYQLTIYAAQVSPENATFINTLTAGYAIGGLIMGVCPTDNLTDLLLYADNEISFQGGLVNPDTNSDVIRFEVTANFKTQGIEVYEDTEGVFS